MSSFQTIAQYYNFLRLGKSGYTAMMKDLVKLAIQFANKIEKTGLFNVLSDIHRNVPAIPVITFSLKEKHKNFDEYDIMRRLKQYGWIVPAYQMCPNEKEKSVLRVVVREQHSEDILSHLMNHLMEVVESLMKEEKKVTGEKTQGAEDESKIHRHTTYNNVC